MEMQVSQNGECKTPTWEEEMYWKHFHAMHFFILLPNDFHHHLVLPSKFAEHVSSKLPYKVTLIGPSGSSWDVEVSKTGNLTALVGDGWKDFVKTYNLEENLMMVFKYKQNSSFEALIFDQKNMCEKESCYFVKKTLPKLNHGIVGKRSVRRESTNTEMMENNDGNGGSECLLSKKPKKGTIEAPMTTPGAAGSSEDDYDDDDPEFIISDTAVDDVDFHVLTPGKKSPQGLKSCSTNDALTKDGGSQSEGTIAKVQTGRKSSDDSSGRKLDQLNEVEQFPTGNEESDMYEKVVLAAINRCNTFSGGLLAEAMNGDSSPTMNTTSRKPVGKRGRPAKRALPNSIRKLVFKSGTKRLSKEYMSHRRPVSSEDTDNALRRATEALTEDGFIVVMRPTGVYKRFYLNIPAEWMHKNLPGRHKEVILRVGEKTWVTMFNYYGQRGHSGGLTTGWKNFAIQNNLEESDVCLFKPATTNKDAVSVILDVQIFRVVEEITPLTPMICSI